MRLPLLCLFAFMALAIAVGPPAAQSATDAKRADGLDAMGVPLDYVVSYQDEHGKTLTAEAFNQQAASRPFSILKNPTAHRATLVFMSDEAIAKAKSAATKPAQLPAVGHPFPAFAAATTDGAHISNATYRGKTVLVNFFFSPCGPCIAETPALAAFHAQHPETDVLAVTFDGRADAVAFARQRGLSWPVAYDQQWLADNAKITVYPVLMVIGPDGVVTKAAVSTRLNDGKPLTPDFLAAWVKTG